jgi:hypothetical protein
MGNSSNKAKNDNDEGDNNPWIWAIRDPEILDWKDSITEGPFKEDEILTILAAQSNHPVQISSYLYLSNAVGAHNIIRLKQLGITHVLNVAGVMASPESDIYTQDGIAVKIIEADDEDGYPMLHRHLEDARLYIAQARKCGGKCVVHCMAGINRSGVIVAAEKLLTERMYVLDVVAHLRKQRGNICLSNQTFQEELVALAQKEGLLGPLPDYSQA